MKIECGTCNTVFRIADELVRGKVVKFRCKQCAAVLEAHIPEPLKKKEGPPAHKAPPPPPLPDKEWHLSRGDQQHGPFSLPEIVLFIRRGLAGAEDLLWKKGMGMWEPVALTEEVTGALSQPRLDTQIPFRNPTLMARSGAGDSPPPLVMNDQAPTLAEFHDAQLVDGVTVTHLPQTHVAGTRASLAAVQAPAFDDTQAMPQPVFDQASGQAAVSVAIQPSPEPPMSQVTPLPISVHPPLAAAGPGVRQRQPTAEHCVMGSLDEPMPSMYDIRLPGRRWLPWAVACGGVGLCLVITLTVLMTRGTPPPPPVERPPARTRVAFTPPKLNAVQEAAGDETGNASGSAADRIAAPGQPVASRSSGAGARDRSRRASKASDRHFKGQSNSLLSHRRNAKSVGPAELALSSLAGTAARLNIRGPMSGSTFPDSQSVPVLDKPLEGPDRKLVEAIKHRPGDAKTVLAAQVYSRNKSTLAACQSLAERRGESIEGIQVLFRITVNPMGMARVNVSGDNVSKNLMTCYRSVARQWKFPRAGIPYTTMFIHRG